MRDRFPLLVLALLLLGGGTVLVMRQSARRGGFADKLSTYRSAPDGARGLFLLAQRSGLDLTRRHLDFGDLDPARALLLLDVHEVGKSEADALQKFVTGGGRLVVVAAPAKEEGLGFSRLLGNPRGVLEAFDVKLEPSDSPELERTIEVAAASPLTTGVEALEAKVAGTLDREAGKPFLPFLTDPHDDDKPVGIVFPHGSGRVVVISAPDLASNRSLARADNARLWLTLLGTLGPAEVDEFHHGFAGDRSISQWAAAYGLHWALAQLLLGLWVWVASLRRFGPARAGPREERVGKADYLLAMARVYRLGGHRVHAAGVLRNGLLRTMARLAGLGPKAELPEVVRALERRGRVDLARALTAADGKVAAAGAGEESLLQLGRACAGVRKLAEVRHRGGDASPRSRLARLRSLRLRRHEPAPQESR